MSINKSALSCFWNKIRGYGAGSLHIRSTNLCEASYLLVEKDPTRGLIVEGDGDDEKTFTFRALSRQNRQGFNVTGDGKLIWGAVKDTHRSRLYVEHNENDSPCNYRICPKQILS